MKFTVRSNKSSFTDTYEIHLAESTRKAVRQTAYWTGVTVVVIAAVVIKRNVDKSKNSPVNIYYSQES